MLEIAVNYLVQRLVEWGRENYELIRGAKENFDNLVTKLGALAAFLKDASRINRTDDTWNLAMKRIRRVVYQAEDSVEKFLVDADKHFKKGKTAQWFDISYRRSLWNIAVEIEEIGKTVQELRKEYQPIFDAFQMNNQPSLNIPQQFRQDLAEENDVVGFDGEANIVIGRLIGGSEFLEAVPIVGMAGLGKSTLTNKVFKDQRIIYEFFNHIWVNVSRNSKKDILLSILTSLKKRANEHENMNEEQLTTEIRICLEGGGRTLIVLDNVWDKYIYEFIKPVFPQKNNRHRMMVTTREEGVGRYFNKDIHELKFLTDDESWLLLKKKVFKRESCHNEELIEPGKKIAKKCSGLPLAIVVIAGALVDKDTKKEWERVIQTMADCLIDRKNPNSCLGFVKMSYDLLSYDEKVCFLYCATFPGSFNIPAWKLIRLWISEGFILNDKNLTLEEKAENYLDDLTRKNLVMVMERTSDGQTKTCRVHDMLYLFCKKEANAEYFFEEIRQEPGLSSLVLQESDIYRRICIESSLVNDFLSKFQKKETMELVRSFLCFSSQQMEMKISTVKTIHKVFPMIRVLDVELINGFILSPDFYQLLHLKYISISANFSCLPKNFGNFCNLETLIVTTATQGSTFEIKADIWSMLRLRHLHTNAPAILPSPGVLITKNDSCMQTLSTIAPVSCTKKVFARARNLRKLGIKGDVAELLCELNDLVQLKRLENLKLKHDGYGEGIILPKLVYIFPITLRKLTLSGTQLKWSNMEKLGEVETLEIIKLKEHAFVGESWVPEIGGFSNLLILWIERTDLRIWKASNRNFPKLKKLVLKSCENLEEVPEGLADIHNLQEMNLENTHKEAVRSARHIEEKLKHRSSSRSAFKLSVFPPDC